MTHNRFLSILLAAAMLAEVVIAGWGHSHASHADGSHHHLGAAAHAHHHHSHTSHENSSPPVSPTDKDDCSVCRHLALAAILLLDLEPVASDEAAERLPPVESSRVASVAVGLYRPRSPPELS